MKFKVKVDLSMVEIFMNILAIVFGFGILGFFISAIIDMGVGYKMAELFLGFYAIVLVALVIAYTLKAVLNSAAFGSSNEETKTEKLLKEVLEELRELKNNQNK